jgi:hypothetical protein
LLSATCSAVWRPSNWPSAWRIEVNAIAMPLSRCNALRISAGREAHGAFDCSTSSTSRALVPRRSGGRRLRGNIADRLHRRSIACRKGLAANRFDLFLQLGQS